MPRRKRWSRKELAPQVVQYELLSWRYFHDFVYQEMMQHQDFVWRGHRCDNWKLSSTLDRSLETVRAAERDSERVKHLQAFQYATRGRRGSNPPRLVGDELWALGQHNGLVTPLLDWTTSPFVAAFFAFVEEGPKQTLRRAIWALDRSVVEEANEQIRNSHLGPDRPPVIDFVRPMSDENARLVNQGGLFTHAPDDEDIDSWVRSHCRADYEVLIKVTIPNQDRLDALKDLNRMNINHLALFPDLLGASAFCNMCLQIKGYEA